ncbi:VanZ family protein [Actinoplanes sp. N902-109]|uniref:VanZ family protein n=1 Tax=Actinoplanes sp. (strain N902-109) TaxID=649831 RepID=UPI0003293C24|nr:VanZ family protein [Actinoplanes sp. N902-109]AGL15476.1 VanZ family protein [Actinoplanes sp. N902-109]
MISTFLVEHRWIAPVALLLVVLVGPLAGSWLVTRTKIAWMLTAASMVPLALLTLVPQNRELFARCAVRWELPTLTGPESLANILLFVAPVLLAGVAARRPVPAVLAGSGLSVLVEAVQAAVPAIGRSCDSGDWITNTIGAVIGGALAWLSLTIAGRRAASMSTAGHR